MRDHYPIMKHGIPHSKSSSVLPRPCQVQCHHIFSRKYVQLFFVIVIVFCATHLFLWLHSDDYANASIADPKKSILLIETLMEQQDVMRDDLKHLREMLQKMDEQQQIKVEEQENKIKEQEEKLEQHEEQMKEQEKEVDHHDLPLRADVVDEAQEAELVPSSAEEQPEKIPLLPVAPNDPKKDLPPKDAPVADPRKRVIPPRAAVPVQKA